MICNADCQHEHVDSLPKQTDGDLFFIKDSVVLCSCTNASVQCSSFSFKQAAFM